jgi:hypothetical protein
MALSAVTKTPELALDPDEAKELAKAAAEVQKHYDTVIDPKTLAWVQLGMVAASVYGPRMIAVNIRLKNEKAQRRQQASNVVHLNRNDAPTG